MGTQTCLSSFCFFRNIVAIIHLRSPFSHTLAPAQTNDAPTTIHTKSLLSLLRFAGVAGCTDQLAGHAAIGQKIRAGDGSNIAAPWTTQGLIVPHSLADTANTIHFHEQEYTYLPWAAGRLIVFSFGRNNLVDDNLVGDLRLYHLTIEVPTR